MRGGQGFDLLAAVLPGSAGRAGAASDDADEADQPARGAARPVSPFPAHRRTPGTRDELAFDSQKRKRNYKNPLTGSVHASRGLPDTSGMVC